MAGYTSRSAYVKFGSTELQAYHRTFSNTETMEEIDDSAASNGQMFLAEARQLLGAVVSISRRWTQSSRNSSALPTPVSMERSES